jgi:hypothetical protein
MTKKTSRASIAAMVRNSTDYKTPSLAPLNAELRSEYKLILQPGRLDYLGDSVFKRPRFLVTWQYKVEKVAAVVFHALLGTNHGEQLIAEACRDFRIDMGGHPVRPLEYMGTYFRPMAPRHPSEEIVAIDTIWGIYIPVDRDAILNEEKDIQLIQLLLDSFSGNPKFPDLEEVIGQITTKFGADSGRAKMLQGLARLYEIEDDGTRLFGLVKALSVDITASRLRAGAGTGAGTGAGATKSPKGGRHR